MKMYPSLKNILVNNFIFYLQKMKKFLFELRQRKDFRVFCFTTFNALISFVLTYLASTQIDPRLIAIAPFLVAFLNVLTKYINEKYFGDLGVKKEEK
jgi:hypothetical protein